VAHTSQDDVCATRDPSGHFMGQYNSTGGYWWEEDIRFGGRILAYNLGGVHTVFLHKDILGSSHLATDPAGNTLQDQLFYPFGQSWTSLGTWQEQGFAGFDSLEGSQYPTQFRRYLPTEGRWLTPDPAGLAAVDLTNPRSLNRYAYVMNNPTTLIDPSGLDTVSCTINGQPGFCTTVTGSGGNGGSCEDTADCGGAGGGTGDVPCYLTEGYYCGYGPPQQSQYPYGPPPGSRGGGGGTQTAPPIAKPQPRPPMIGPAPPSKPPDNRPSCISVAWNVFDPDPVTGDAIGQASETASQAIANAGVIYAAAKGLTVPLRSPYFRAFADLTEFAGFGGQAAPVVFLAVDVLPAVATSAKANLTGQCQNNFWSLVAPVPVP